MVLGFGGKYELKVSGYNDPTFKQIDITIILNSSWFFYWMVESYMDFTLVDVIDMRNKWIMTKNRMLI